MRVDIVRELIDRLMVASQREGGLSERLAQEVERQFRHDYKGAACVISERPRREIPPEVVKADYLAGKPVEQVTSAHGISRSTLYRLLKK